MRWLIILGTVSGIGVGFAAPASAQSVPNYPFCLFPGGDDGGFERCNYRSFDQCLYDRQAEGGVCYTNPNFKFYAAPRRYRR